MYVELSSNQYVGIGKDVKVSTHERRDILDW